MAKRSRSMLLSLLIVSGVLAGALEWGVITRTPASEPVLAANAAGAEDDPANPVEAAPMAASATQAAAPSDPLDAQAAMLAAPLARVTLARQKLRRGGLGSQVRATLTVRNRHDFAIKDVEILCAFQGQGGYTTQRRRVLHDTIDGKRSETFADVLIGHINVTAPRGRCRLLGASRA